MIGLEPGHNLGRYRIEAKLGSGGMGEVYRAWDSTLQRWVALKVVSKENASMAARLLGEARASAALRHPNIVSVFDVGEDEAYAFVSMDLVEGRPLRDYVAEASVPYDQKLAWLLQVASALRAAHKAGLIHRDVKPDNVMISVEGDARVLDFGLAKSFTVDVEAPTAHSDAATTPEPQPFLTGVGLVSGTPAYMAPEQLAGGPPSPLWDEYAWGALACELLTGKHPRIAGLIGVSGSLNPEALAHLPETIAHVVTRAMAPVAAQRFASMDEIVAALGGPTSAPVAGVSMPPKGQTTPPPTDSAIGDTLQVPVHPNAPVQPRSRRGLWALLALGTVLVAGASTAAWWRYAASRHVASTPMPQPSASEIVSSPPVASSVAPIESAAVTASAATSTPAQHVAPPVPPTPKKLAVRLTGMQSFQYDAATVENAVRPLKPVVQSCVEQHAPHAVPSVLTVTLELWSVGQELGKVRDARVAKESPALTTCLRDAFMPLVFPPPKSPSMALGAIFVMVRVDSLTP